MHWGTCSEDTEVTMPMHIWEAETEVEKQKHNLSWKLKMQAHVKKLSSNARAQLFRAQSNMDS